MPSMKNEASTSTTYTAFRGHVQIAGGPLKDVAMSLRTIADSGDSSLVLIFDDAKGGQIDIDLAGSLEEVARRFGGEVGDPQADSTRRRGPGRPKLGVVGREVTLLPRHWGWLQTQRGGPSATLRRLVDEARAISGDRDEVRQAQDAINRFISAIAGDLPGFEEANRALYRGDRDRFGNEIRRWPPDLRRYIEHWTESAFRFANET